MKKNLLKKILLALLVVVAGAAFTACSDDDNESGQIVYSYGFDDFHSSNLAALSEMQTVENAFKSALGVSGSPFTLNGSTNECDRKVTEGCQKAVQSLKDKVWSFSGTFTVTNVNTGKVVYTLDIVEGQNLY
ncbi:MAG: hypothetical protein HFJ94_03310 [Muribaculaceae bacterium]|jgi:hypothetical protein|nr:hypothetical protein [Muribaculaceae bacterium]